LFTLNKKYVCALNLEKLVYGKHLQKKMLESSAVSVYMFTEYKLALHTKMWSYFVTEGF